MNEVKAVVDLVRQAMSYGVMLALEDPNGIAAKLRAAGPDATLGAGLEADAESFVRIRADLVEALRTVR